MCNSSKYYLKEVVHEERIKRIQVMIRKGHTKDDIIDIGYTKEEFSEAEKKNEVVSVNILFGIEIKGFTRYIITGSKQT